MKSERNSGRDSRKPRIIKKNDLLKNTDRESRAKKPEVAGKFRITKRSGKEPGASEKNESFRGKNSAFHSDSNHSDRRKTRTTGSTPSVFSGIKKRTPLKKPGDRIESERGFQPSYPRDTEAGKVYKRPEKLKSSTRTGRNNKSTYRSKAVTNDNEMRLNRFIAHSGICSRRQADDYISAGLVTVNGKVVTEMGVKIKPSDVVKYNGESIRSEKKVYILLNKPKDYVTSLDDEQGRRTVIDLVSKAGPERVYPVGRLDRNTTGVLLLTNDGDLTGKLTHPKYNKKKIYHVYLDKNLKREDMKSITNGVTLEDGPFAPDSISYIDPAKKSELGIEIHSGRNRIVRRLFEYFGYKVIRLDRVYFAGLTKKNLARGKWRFLTEKEVSLLKMNAYE